MGAQWLSGRVLDSRPRGLGFEPHRRHCVVSLSKNINPSLVLVQHRKTRPFITERLLMGRKNSNLTYKMILSKQLETVFTGVIPISLFLLATGTILRKAAIDRGVRLATGRYGCRYRGGHELNASGGVMRMFYRLHTL